MIEKMREILAEFCDLDGICINEDTIISSDIGLSSLDYLEFISRLEEEFNVTFKDDEIREFRTIGDIVRCMNSK